MYSIYSILIIIEFSYILELFIESSKAFDQSGQKVYEIRWRKTAKYFWSSFNSKIYVVNIVPWGALGYIKSVRPLRILWLLKIYRTKTFLKVFAYSNYHAFFRTVLNYRMMLKNAFEET